MNENSLILTIKSEYLVTKIAVYQQTDLVFLKTISHPAEMVDTFSRNTDQFRFRGEAILSILGEAGIDSGLIHIVMARGGLLKPIPSGIYKVNEKMKADLHDSPVGTHSINIGGLIADYIASKIVNSQAFIADPPVVDELEEIARMTGFPGIERKSIFHALNHKYVARRFASSIRKNYEELNLVVAHLGDGISIGAHQKGRVVDVNQCFDGEGPLSLERTGTLPMVDLVGMCFSGKYSHDEILSLIRTSGGLVAFFGREGYDDLEKNAFSVTEPMTKLFEAMAYQVAKYIGYMLPVFKAPADAVIITGILAGNPWFTSLIAERIKYLAPVHIFPGEDVLDALAHRGNMILSGEAEILDYK